MLTEAQVLEIERHCQEQGVPYKQRLGELNINPNQFYRTKQKLLFRLDNSSNGQFLQIGTDNSFMEAASLLKHKRKKVARALSHRVYSVLSYVMTGVQPCASKARCRQSTYEQSYRLWRAMFSLNDSLRYWLYSEPTDMCKSFFSLSGIVTDRMGKDIHSTDVFIFLNRPCTRIKQSINRMLTLLLPTIKMPA